MSRFDRHAYADDEDLEEEEEEEEEGDAVPQHIADLANTSTPASLKGLRACKRCGIIKTLEQFMNEGCENCPFLEMVRDVYALLCSLCVQAIFLIKT